MVLLLYLLLRRPKPESVKYNELIVSGYIFQPVAIDCQGNYGPLTAPFIKCLLKRVKAATHESRAGAFFHQRLSVMLQQFNSACVLGTIADDSSLDEIFLFLN